ncbi:MAG: DUF4249 family protein [Bacteroidales bacterium]
MLKIKAYCLFLFLFIVYGCEIVVEFPKFDGYQESPVIEAVLTDTEEIQYVKVSKSVSISDSILSRPVENATVYVFSDIGDTIFYNHNHDGCYQSPLFKSVTGINYTLCAIIDGIPYYSSGKTIPMKGIDSVYYKYLERSYGLEDAYYVFCDVGITDQQEINYYQFNIFKNNNLYTNGNRLWVFNDKYNKEIKDLNLPVAFEKGDTIIVELLSLSKELYEYYFALTNQVFNTSIVNIGYNSNLPMLFNPIAMGYFQVSSVNRRTLIIE